MDYSKIDDPPSTDSRGNKVPSRLLRDLKKLQSEAMQNMPEGPRHCLSIDRSGEAQLLTVRTHMSWDPHQCTLTIAHKGC